MEHALHDAPAWAAAVEAGAWGAAMRSSFILYPLANVLHVLAFACLLGPAILLDLRLLGVARRVALEPLSRLATPFLVLGLLVLIATGASMFTADARALAQNPVLLSKWVLIALGLSNAVLFRWLWRDSLADWDIDPPGWGRAQAAASLTLWVAVGALGRLIAYF